MMKFERIVHGPAQDYLDYQCCNPGHLDALKLLALSARTAWQEHYDTCDDPDLCAHDAPGLEEVEALEDQIAFEVIRLVATGDQD